MLSPDEILKARVARRVAAERLVDAQFQQIEAAVRAKVAGELRAAAQAILDDADDPLARRLWAECSQDPVAPAVLEDPRRIAYVAYRWLAGRVERRGLLAEPAPANSVGRARAGRAQAAALGADPAQARMDDRREAAIAKFVEVVTRQSGAVIDPSGCRYCGVDQRAHGQRWTRAASWHQWTEPTMEQRKARMLARRARKAPTR